MQARLVPIDLVARSRRLLVVLTVGVVLAASGGRVFAQPATGGTLRVTVVDPSGAVIVGAKVTVTGADDATKAVTIAPVQTSDISATVAP